MNDYSYQWQYTGIVPFVDIVEWCRSTFGYVDWFWRNETVHFAHEQDYSTFLLRWA